MEIKIALTGLENCFAVYTACARMVSVGWAIGGVVLPWRVEEWQHDCRHRI
jgi:hypothetical protein